MNVNDVVNRLAEPDPNGGYATVPDVLCGAGMAGASEFGSHPEFTVCLPPNHRVRRKRPD